MLNIVVNIANMFHPLEESQNTVINSLIPIKLPLIVLNLKYIISVQQRNTSVFLRIPTPPKVCTEN